MRTVISIAVIIAAAVVGFIMGSGMNEPLGGAALFAVIAGFGCTIQAVEGRKKL